MSLLRPSKPKFSLAEKLLNYAMQYNCTIGWAAQQFERESGQPVPEKEIIEGKRMLASIEHVEKVKRMYDERWVD